MKTYIATWFNYSEGRYDVRHSEMFDAESYSIAFGKARIINNKLNLFDYKCLIKRVEPDNIRQF